MKRLLTLLLLGLSLFPAGLYAEEAECIQSEEHDTFSYLLIDRSDFLKDADKFKQTLDVVEKKISPGERLIIGVSTDKGSNTRVLLDLVKPKGGMWVSPMKTRAANKKFASCFGKVIDHLTAESEEHKYSALLETLRFVSKVFSAEDSKTKRLFLYSDMMQNSETLSFYKLGTQAPDQLMKKTEGALLQSKFRNVTVWVAGTGESVNDKKDRELEAFWTKYFEAAGAELKFYGPILVS